MACVNDKLYLAIQNTASSVDEIKMIIQSGADINAKDGYGKTLLHHAASIPDCNRNVIKEVIKSGADVNARDIGNRTPLHIAAEHPGGNFNLICELLGSGAEANAEDGEGNTPLHYCAKSVCHWDAIGKLINSGAEVNTRNHIGSVPLHFALEQSDSHDVVRALLSRGADVNIRNGAGSMPLHLALKYNAGNCTIKDLLEAGASVNDRNEEGDAPIHLAARSDRSLALYVRFGASVCAINHYGNTLFHDDENLRFTEYLRIKLVQLKAYRELLRMKKISLHGEAQSSKCSLHLIKKLLKTGGKVNIQDVKGMSPLLYVAGNPNCDPNVVLFLVKNGACVNSVDIKGYSALHHAMRNALFKLATVKTLLKCGAKVGIRNWEGDNVLQYALKCNSIENELLDCMKLLVKYAVLQNEFLSDQFLLEMTFRLPELSPFTSDCLAEWKRMKRELVPCCGFTWLEFCTSDVERSTGDVERVFQSLESNSFLMYTDVILDKIEKKFLLNKVLEVEMHTGIEEPSMETLIPDCVPGLAAFLSKTDLLNLFIAYTHVT